MSTQNLIENYMLNNNVSSDIYGSYSEGAQNEIPNNMGSTTLTENNNSLIEENRSSESIGFNKVKKVNYIKKPNTNNLLPDIYIKNQLFKANRNEAIEKLKQLDHYFSETLVHEFFKEEHKIFCIEKSRNYIPKKKFPKYFQANNFTVDLYYKLKIKNMLFCTFLGTDYHLIKKVYHTSSNTNPENNEEHQKRK